MKQITISTENCETYSSISNFFIDYYMTEANGEFVKVYLYLVRLLNKESSISVAEIADHFNLTENDICRAIKYWIGKDVLRLNYNGKGQLSGIVLLPLSAPGRDKESGWDAMSILSIGASRVDAQEEEKASVQEMPAKVQDAKQENAQREKVSTAVVTPFRPAERQLPERHSYTPAVGEKLQQDEDWAYMLYQLETLFAKTITQRDMDSLFYIYDDLRFDADLIEYLIEYCVTLNKKNCRYMEAVAINWYKENITTVAEAKASSQMVTGLLKSVYKELGIRRSYPTNYELEFVDNWTKKLLFSDELVILACQKAMLSKPGNASFPYVNGILESWHKNNVKTKKDVEALDAAFAMKKEREKAERNQGGSAVSNFHDFKQSKMDDKLSEMEQLFLKEVNKK